MVLDTVTGKPERFGGDNAVMTIKKAMEYLGAKKGWEDRTVLVRMNCIMGFEL
jgi:hypothetical protein